jgi:hypothetical protein
MTPLEMIGRQLWKWDRKGHLEYRPQPELQAPNVAAAVPNISVRTRHGRTVSSSAEALSILEDGSKVASVCYAKVAGAYWMSRDIEEKIAAQAYPWF